MRAITTSLKRLIFVIVAILSSPAWSKNPPPVEVYGDLPAIEHGAISASGDRLAFISKVDGDRWLLIFDSSLKLLRSSAIGDIKLRDITWIGDEGVLVTSSETEGLPMGFTTTNYEAVRAMTVPVDSDRPITMVFTNTRGIIHSVFGQYGVRKVKERWKGYFGGIALAQSSVVGYVFSNADITLFEVDLFKNTATRSGLPASSGYSRRWLVDEDGEIAARLDLNWSKGDWRLIGAKGKEIAKGIHADGDIGLISLGQDGKSVIYWAEDDNEVHWYEMPLDGSSPPVKFLDESGARSPFIGKYDSRMLGYKLPGTKPKPVFFSDEWNNRAEKVGRAFAKLDYDIIDWNESFTKVIVRTSGNGDSGTWFLVDIDTLRASPVGNERPTIVSTDVGPVSVFQYSAQDGLDLDGILTLPPGREAKDLPVVLLPHGGPASFDRPQFDWWAQAFASRGYAVFQPNFRGSTNRSASFRRAGYGEWGLKMQTDISDGLAALAEKGIVNPKRACIMGASYGGYAALAGVTVQQGLYRCAVSVAGIGDLKRMYDTDMRESGLSNVMRKALEETLGNRSDLADVSPENFAARADAPILLIHGRDDIVVRYDQSTRMAKALEKAGKPYEFVELKAEDHWLSRAETRKQMLSAAMEFVQKHNPAD